MHAPEGSRQSAERFTAPALATAGLAVVLQTLYKVAGIFEPWASYIVLCSTAMQVSLALLISTLSLN